MAYTKIDLEFRGKLVAVGPCFCVRRPLSVRQAAHAVARKSMSHNIQLVSIWFVRGVLQSISKSDFAISKTSRPNIIKIEFNDSFV